MDQAATLRRIELEKVNRIAPLGMRVIAVTSGKGGVGKTNLVLNLCYALGQLGKRVLLFDADMGLANADVILGLVPQYTLEHVLSGDKEMSSILLDGPGFKVLPSGSGVSALAEISPEQQMYLMEQLSAYDGEFDYLFVDTGAGIAGNVLRFNASADQILVVVSPEPTSITDAYALIKLLAMKYYMRKFSLVVNSCLNESEGRSVYETINRVCRQFLEVDIEWLGLIPLDNNLRKSVRRQKLLIESMPKSAASRGIAKIAQRIVDDKAEQPKDGAAFWERLLKWRQ